MCERYICGMGFTSEEKPIRIIHDKVEDKEYYLFADICKIMNEQQDTINDLENQIKQLEYTCDCYDATKGIFLEDFLMFIFGIDEDSDEELSDGHKKLVNNFLYANEQDKGFANNICNNMNEQKNTIKQLKKRLDYETRMHKRWKDDCLAILEEQDLNDYVEELQKSKKSGWDSEPNTDYVTRVKEGLK